MAGALEYKDKDVLQILMHFCELRGEDSTGVFAVPKVGAEASIIKTVGPTRTFFDTIGWDKLQTSGKRAIIGHCRKATIGGIKRSTAHPFTYGKMTGVHNGTLKNWRYLPGETLETDSMTLYDNFDRVGVKETIEATEGAYALIWWNEETEELNVLRNGERPLFYCFSEDFKKIFWASESWMLHIALDKCGVKRGNLTPGEQFATTVLPVDTDTWWKIKIDGGHGVADPLKFLTEKNSDHVESLKGGVAPAKYVAAPFRGTVVSPFPDHRPGSGSQTNVSGGSGNLPALRHASPAATGTAAESTTTKNSSSDTSSEAAPSQTQASRESQRTLSLVPTSRSDGSAASGNDNPALDVVVGYNGLVLNKEEYAMLVDPNCIWCQGPVSFDEIIADPSIIGDWTDEDSFICSGCVSNTHGYSQGSFTC
jgi:hypothetical protein